MNTTTVREFRERLSSWFEKSKTGPVFISRKDERFVMLSEEDYYELKDKIDTLQSALISEMSGEKSYRAKDILRKNKDLKKAN